MLSLTPLMAVRVCGIDAEEMVVSKKKKKNVVP